ncbi:MAG: D-alanyl-D-alanine carboxypeptidase [Clostridia bacterium]|nr:D-alanyl-D-alanine carboxypeptidase [Clostridia bacterium]
MKKAICVILSVALFFVNVPMSFAQKEIMPFDVEAESAVLMDVGTGTVLYAKNPDEALPPASVTKVMTLLLVMEHIDSGKMKLSDMVPISEYAASMGGSQVFLEPGEDISCEDLLKSVVISSANDGAVAFAEAVAGSEEAFVKRMNERAGELGMKSTRFENATGLDDDTKDHKMSALDIALVSRELILNHPDILKYSSIWMDSIRNGEFGLSNTNRLIRFYKGATGLKTGSTAKAGFCISATAKRDGMHLIAVIMGAKTRDERNNAAKKLLDHGFASYSIYTHEKEKGKSIKVTKGEKEKVATYIDKAQLLLPKEDLESVEIKKEYKKELKAPVKKGDKVGEATFLVKGKEVLKTDILAKESVDKLSYGDILLRLLKSWFLR